MFKKFMMMILTVKFILVIWNINKLVQIFIQTGILRKSVYKAGHFSLDLSEMITDVSCPWGTSTRCEAPIRAKFGANSLLSSGIDPGRTTNGGWFITTDGLIGLLTTGNELPEFRKIIWRDWFWDAWAGAPMVNTFLAGFEEFWRSNPSPWKQKNLAENT
jgi:hypothetical protein